MQAKFKGTQHSILNKSLSENHFLNIVIVLMPAVSQRQYHRVIFWQSLDTPMLPLLLNFYTAFVRMDPLNILAKFEVRI